MSRCWLVAVTWPPEAKCDVKKCAFRPGDGMEDTPEAVCAIVKTMHHRRGTKYYYPLTTEIIYEIDPSSLPAPITETQRAPQPLSSPPRPLTPNKK
jgi:hypothetical protein